MTTDSTIARFNGLTKTPRFPFSVSRATKKAPVIRHRSPVNIIDSTVERFNKSVQLFNYSTEIPDSTI